MDLEPCFDTLGRRSIRLPCHGGGQFCSMGKGGSYSTQRIRFGAYHRIEFPRRLDPPDDLVFCHFRQRLVRRYSSTISRPICPLILRHGCSPS